MTFLKRQLKSIMIIIILAVPPILIGLDYSVYDIANKDNNFHATPELNVGEIYNKKIIEIPTFTQVILTFTRITKQAEFNIFLLTDKSYSQYMNGQPMIGAYAEEKVYTIDESKHLNVEFPMKTTLYLVISQSTGFDPVSFDISIVFYFDAYYMRKGLSIFILSGLYYSIYIMGQSLQTRYHQNNAAKKYREDIEKKEDEFYDKLLGKLN